MLEKVKEFLVAAASVTALLYAAGYIVDFSHAAMLGITMVEPSNESYLITGGMFFISNLYAVYATLLTHFLYYIPFALAILLLFHYDIKQAAGQKISHLRKIYMSTVSLFIFIYLFKGVPVFMAPLDFKNMLLTGTTPETGYAGKDLSHLANEMWTWLRNDNPVNRMNLTFFYVLLLLSAVLSVVVVYTMIREIKRWPSGAVEAVETVPGAAGDTSRGTQKSSFWGAVLKVTGEFSKPGFVVLTILACIIALVQIFLLPYDYGILKSSNVYPEVDLLVENINPQQLHPPIMPTPNPAANPVTPPVPVPLTVCKVPHLLEDIDPAYSHTSKVWLLRQSTQEFLFYAVYRKKESDFDAHTLFTLKKESVKKIEIRDNSFILAYK